eukprot:scaffold19324_cov152-Cylindrotheca_fusiformis.AAC.3
MAEFQFYAKEYTQYRFNALWVCVYHEQKAVLHRNVDENSVCLSSAPIVASPKRAYRQLGASKSRTGLSFGRWTDSHQTSKKCGSRGNERGTLFQRSSSKLCDGIVMEQRKDA